MKPIDAGLVPLLVVSVLAGCAEYQPHRGEPAPDALDAYLNRPRQAQQEEVVYGTADGRDLGFLAYRQPRGTADVALVSLHGIESHAAWFEAAARLLQDRRYDVYCLDRRGSGINRENRGCVSGHADSFDQLLDDLRFFIRPLRRRYDRVYLVGLAWGGKYALGYGLTCPDDVDGLILVTPSLRAKVDVDGFTKLAILVAKDVEPKSQFVIPIVPEMFTNHRDLLWYIRHDPLRLRSASARFLYESHRLDGYIDRLMPQNRLPILLFLAGLDPLIDNDKVVDVLRRGGQDVFDIVEYEDQSHAIQLETPGRMVKDMDRWLERRTSAPASEKSDPTQDGA